jgi:rare lipoprotein A
MPTRYGATRRAMLLTTSALVTGCASMSDGDVVERGRASWYGEQFHGRRTASGERFDSNALTAAHPSWPFGTVVRVRNVRNGREVTVRINDRGPSVKGRIIDLSQAAAKALGMVSVGHAEVELRARLPARR